MSGSRGKVIDWGSSIDPNTTLDDEPTVILQSLLIGATQENDVGSTLGRVYRVIVSNGIESEIDALTAVPLLLSLKCTAATELLDLISTECSAKELIIAIQEGSESLRRRIQDAEEESEGEDTHITTREENHVSIAVQSTRLLKICSRAISRLRKGKMSAENALGPVLSELKMLILENVQFIKQADAQPLLNGMIEVIGSTVTWAKGELSDGLVDTLFGLVTDVLEAYGTYTGACIAETTFRLQYPRLARMVSPTRVAETDAAKDAWSTLSQAGISMDSIKDHPSIGNLILLVHSSTELSMATLQKFLPAIVTCVRTNTAIEEALALLMRALPPYTPSSPPPPLTHDLSTILTHLLSQLASVHPDATLRHITFRVLGHVFWCTPPPLRLQLLADILGDADTPEQMHIAGVGLVRESVLEAFGAAPPVPNVFASPELVGVLGPVVFRPRLPGHEDAEDSLEAFLQTPEPARLVEAFGLLFLLLQRDSANSTGIRSKESLELLRKELIQPVQYQLRKWDTVDLEEAEEAKQQLGILDMWVERVSDQVNEMLQAERGL